MRGLQWGSETGSRRRGIPGGDLGGGAVPSMGLRDWVSEKAPYPAGRRKRAQTFNGAPRLGLGEGWS